MAGIIGGAVDSWSLHRGDLCQPNPFQAEEWGGKQCSVSIHHFPKSRQGSAQQMFEQQPLTKHSSRRAPLLYPVLSNKLTPLHFSSRTDSAGQTVQSPWVLSLTTACNTRYLIKEESVWRVPKNGEGLMNWVLKIQCFSEYWRLNSHLPPKKELT